MKYSYSEKSLKYMAGHGIHEADVQKVVDTAEHTGKKAVCSHGDLSMAKLVIGPVTIYAHYKGDKHAGVTVEEVYSHRVKLLEEG